MMGPAQFIEDAVKLKGKCFSKTLRRQAEEGKNLLFPAHSKKEIAHSNDIRI